MAQVFTDAILVSANPIMSTYNNYEVASNNYDLGRIPSGSDVHIAMMQGYIKKPLKDVSFSLPRLCWILCTTSVSHYVNYQISRLMVSFPYWLC